MENFLNQIGGVDIVLLFKAFIFFLCGVLGMVIAYSQRWARDKVACTWWEYMTGDGHEISMAMTKLVTACWVAGSFEYLSSLSVTAVVNAGVLIGMAVPNKVDEAKIQEKINVEKGSINVLDDFKRSE